MTKNAVLKAALSLPLLAVLAACGSDSSAPAPIVVAPTPAPSPTPTASPVMLSDIRYSTAATTTGTIDLFLDIYQPKAACFWGSSAGAFTVLHVAYSLDGFGIERPAPSFVTDYWDGLFRASDLDASEAPFFAAHGTQDGTVDYQFAVDLTARADLVGVDYALYTMPDTGHGFGSDAQADAIDAAAVDFAQAHFLGGAPVYGSFSVPQ